MNVLTPEYLKYIREMEELCPDCKSRNTIFSNETNGTRVCKACGSVQEINMIDETSEWRNFGSESSGPDMNRVGGPVNSNLDSSGISTVITGQGDQKLISSSNRISSNAKDKNKMKGWAAIKDLCQQIHVSKQVQQESTELFSLVEDNEKLKGKKLILKVASCIMIASRKSQLPKNMKDILKGADISKKELSRCYRLILRKVCPKLKTHLKPSQCITQIASSLSLSGEIEDKCKQVAEYLREKEYLTGRSPFTIAGAAVYMVAQVCGTHKKSFREIALAAKLADVTIKNAFKILYNDRFEILSKHASKEHIEKHITSNSTCQ